MYKNKPVIGISMKHDVGNDKFWTKPCCVDALAELGAITVPLPLVDNKEVLDYFIETCDGFFITGGQDVNPSRYNEDLTFAQENYSDLRDEIDSYLVTKSYEYNKTLLGVCRGMQILNVTLGGNLFQDIIQDKATKSIHRMEEPYNRFFHKNNIICPSQLFDVLNVDQISVNSLHHQAVNNVSPKLKIMAVSEDGLTEGIYAPDKKMIWGLQWHPEMLYTSDENSLKILKHFINKTMEK